MSMLSMQIDSLRSHADLYDGTTKPEMAKELQRPYLAQELREAADTVWQLRDDLQRAHRENAKLRELVRDMWGTMGLLDACAVDEYDEPLNCCTVCNQYGSVDEFAGGKRVIGCKLMYRMCELGVDE